MKKINSNSYATHILGGIAVLGLAIPGALYILNRFLSLNAISWAILFFLGLGGLGLLGFIIFLSVEFCQDRRIARQYPSIRDTKISLPKGQWECQRCGSRRLRARDIRCPACGVIFQNTSSGKK